MEGPSTYRDLSSQGACSEHSNVPLGYEFWSACCHLGRLSGVCWNNQDELSPNQHRDRKLGAVTLEKKLML